jgi:hypothetical protein
MEALLMTLGIFLIVFLATPMMKMTTLVFIKPLALVRGRVGRSFGSRALVMSLDLVVLRGIWVEGPG